ncbi:hypothetical protein CKAH01_02211 [Colletotrichum kahawae]|uniref:Uncharacterized protein n=1 Tax=Colletotrichum kahawae TaxID=34407 RepID=A0AAD9Y231_COLKA|nr:hypothetical protein CKAH01_02211 [Colletotrichum kahawae]
MTTPTTITRHASRNCTRQLLSPTTQSVSFTGTSTFTLRIGTMGLGVMTMIRHALPAALMRI